MNAITRLRSLLTFRNLAATLCVLVGGAFGLLQSGACFTPPTRAQVVKVETELCAARAAYKLANAATGGKLDPVPGSPRARLEQAEDNFCAARAAPDAGAGGAP